MKAKVIPFEKFEGAGNDFIIFDFFEFEFIDLTEKAFEDVIDLIIKNKI